MPHYALHQRELGRRGFTLLELLTVVAIIVVLISMLLPALSKVREPQRTHAVMKMLS